MTHRLHICQTCQRDGPRDSNGRTRGENLTTAVSEILVGSELASTLSLRRVPCLAGCPNPCNVSLQGAGKPGLRFSHLNAADAADLMEFARAYVASETGEVDSNQWPESLLERLTATLPTQAVGAATSVPAKISRSASADSSPSGQASPMVRPTPILPPKPPDPASGPSNGSDNAPKNSAMPDPVTLPGPPQSQKTKGLLRIRGADKAFGPVVALDQLELDIAEGELFALLGPSASGKTTTLRCIAGVETLDQGQIYFEGEEITDTPVQGRPMAMVFQAFALYPHFSVYNNLAYPLREMGVSRDEIDKRVNQTAEMLGLSHVLQRKPGTASGGEQQRIAIGRALIRRPRLLLLDEPTTNLDAKLRHDTRAEFKRLHRDLGMTVIYATPDELEALSMGERIAVLNEGHVIQTGTPDELYERPDNDYVAAMVGSPKMNLVEARITNTNTVDLGFVEIDDGPWRKAATRFLPGTSVRFGFRPYDVNSSIEGRRFKARVELLEPLGDITIIDLRARQTPFRMVLPEAEAVAWSVNDEIELAIDASESHLFTADTGVCIR